MVCVRLTPDASESHGKEQFYGQLPELVYNLRLVPAIPVPDGREGALISGLRLHVSGEKLTALSRVLLQAAPIIPLTPRAQDALHRASALRRAARRAALGSVCSIAGPACVVRAGALFIRYRLLCSYILLSGPGQSFLQTSTACGRTAFYGSYLTVSRAKEVSTAYTNTEIPALFHTFIVVIKRSHSQEDSDRMQPMCHWKSLNPVQEEQATKW